MNSDFTLQRTFKTGQYSRTKIEETEEFKLQTEKKIVYKCMYYNQIDIYF